MESDFDSRCPVLDCGATWRPEKYRRQTLLHILWPAYEYQVVVPEPRERRINIFQKHIISLTLSGVKSADQIAGYLAIDPELAAFILLELRGLGLLDEAYELTRPAKALLDEERQSQQPKMTVGRVYQDPWTGKLWPRFLSERRASRFDAAFLRGKDLARLQVGTVGNPIVREAILVRPHDNARPRELKPKDVLQAWIDHQEARVEFEQLLQGRADDDTDGGLAGIDPETWLDRIAQIGSAPTPVWVLTYAFVPETITHGAYWRACDPFGFGTSDEMSERIDTRRADDPLLRSEIARISGQTTEDRPMGFTEMAALIHAEATNRVEDELSTAIRKYDRLFRAAIHMESLLIEAGKVADRSHRGLKLMEVVNRAQVVLELAFDWLRRVHRTDRCYEGQGLNDGDMKHNAAMFREMAIKVGFERPPDSLVFVRLGKIVRAANFGDQSINPRLIAALLVAHRDPDHPLWLAAKRFPKMLARIAAIADLRNEAGGAHAGSGDVSLEIDQVKDAVSSVYEIVRRLLPETRESQVLSS